MRPLWGAAVSGRPTESKSLTKSGGSAPRPLSCTPVMSVMSVMSCPSYVTLGCTVMSCHVCHVILRCTGMHGISRGCTGLHWITRGLHWITRGCTGISRGSHGDHTGMHGDLAGSHSCVVCCAEHFLGMHKNDVSPQDVFRLQKGSAADRRVIAEYCIQVCCE